MESLLIIGENAFDIILKAEIGELPDSNYFPEDVIMRVGGTGVNFSYAFKKLKGDGYYLCPVSSDIFGSEIRKFFEKEKIEGYFPESDKQTPLIIAVTNKKGERTTIARIFGTSYTDIRFDDFAKVGKDFSNIYISGGILTEEKPRKEVLKIVKYLYERGTRLFYDPQFRIGKSINNFRKFALELLHYADFVFGNEEEIAEIPGDVIDERLKRGAIVVCKRGEKGAVCLEKDKKFEVEGFKVEPKIIVGAGDVFNAAFVYKILSNVSVENALIFANSIAASYIESGDLIV